MLGPWTLCKENSKDPVGWGCSKTGLDHPESQAD